MKYTIICFFICIACATKGKYPNNDINASLYVTYYEFPEDTKFLYKNKLYSQKEFGKKYNIASFKKIEIIKDKEKILELTQDKNCKAILKVSH